MRRAAAALLLLALTGCGQQAQPALSPKPMATAATTVQAPAATGRVRIQGDDRLAEVLSWSLPKVDIQKPVQARRAAQKALRAGDLFETADSAIPILLALTQQQPEDKRTAALLAQAQAALLTQAWAALAASEDLASLRYAQRMGSVLRSLWPEAPAVRTYQADVDRAGQAYELSVAGEQALRAGNLDQLGGALTLFRKALALWPSETSATQGIIAVESVLILQAEAKARAGDFDAAYLELARAGRVRHDAKTLPAARERIELIRAGLIRRMRDEGLIALGDAAGLQLARERLAEILLIAKPGNTASIELRRRIDLVSHYGLFRPGQTFTDAMADSGRGPELVVIPHGAFQMGAPEDAPDASAAEQPQHLVRFDRGFAMTRHEITVGEFGGFVRATGYVPRATQRGHSRVYDVRGGNFLLASGVDWRSSYNGIPASDAMPVIHITARDAEAYAAWLSEQTDAHYRLPSEAEFEYALRAGGQGRYAWGDGAPPAGIENLAGGRDVSAQGRHWSNAFAGYGDGYWGPAAVGSFAANAFHLFDMAGNVSEWIADCWHKGYRRAPANGAAWVNPGCRTRMYRGGSWASAPEQARSAWRTAGGNDVTNARVGFRLVRQL